MDSNPIESKYNVLLHQLTSPRTAQFALVTAFSTVVVILVVMEKPVPDIVQFMLAAIIGYYFGDDNGDVTIPNGHSVNDVSSRLDVALRATSQSKPSPKDNGKHDAEDDDTQQLDNL